MVAHGTFLCFRCALKQASVDATHGSLITLMAVLCPTWYFPLLAQHAFALCCRFDMLVQIA